MAWEGLNYTLNFRGQLIRLGYPTCTTIVGVTQLESIPLGRLPPHNREPHTLSRITKIVRSRSRVGDQFPHKIIRLSKRFGEKNPSAPKGL